MFTNFQLSTLKNWGFIYWSYVIEDPEDSSLKFWNKTWQHIVNFGQFHFGTSLDNNVKKTKNYSISDFLISEVKKCFKKNCYTQCFKKINNFHFTEKPKTQTRLNSIYLPPPGICWQRRDKREKNYSEEPFDFELIRVDRFFQSYQIPEEHISDYLTQTHSSGECVFQVQSRAEHLQPFIVCRHTVL